MKIKEDFNEKKEEKNEVRETLVEDWMKIKTKKLRRKED